MLLRYLAYLWALILVFLFLISMPVPPWLLPPEMPPLVPPDLAPWPTTVWPSNPPGVDARPTAAPPANAWRPEPRPTIAVPLGPLPLAWAGVPSGAVSGAAEDKVINPSGLPRQVSTGKRTGVRSGASRPAGYNAEDEAETAQPGASPVAVGLAAVGLCGGGAALARHLLQRRAG